MGVNLSSLLIRNQIQLGDLSGRRIAVDANNYLYQFLALIRTRGGFPLQAPDGTVTSHLAGLLFRTTRLIYDFHVPLVFVFDGEPPRQKEEELSRRRQKIEKAEQEWRRAIEEGDYMKAFSKAVVTSRLTGALIKDSKMLLNLLGIPFVQATGEAEAQAAYMAIKGDVWASSSRDYDSLLFGTPRLVRNLTISGKEFLPSKGVSRRLNPELIVLERVLSKHHITLEQLVDLAILIGTDFDEGVAGIGPKTALRIITEAKRIECFPNDLRKKVAPQYEDVRRIFLKPDVTPEYHILYQALQEDKLYEFLCEEKGFSRDHVQKVVRRMRGLQLHLEQADLKKWIDQ